MCIYSVNPAGILSLQILYHCEVEGELDARFLIVLSLWKTFLGSFESFTGFLLNLSKIDKSINGLRQSLRCRQVNA